MYRYITNFYLKGLENCKNKNKNDNCGISNFIIKANEFLQEDNMTLYLKKEIERKINKLIDLNKDNGDNNNDKNSNNNVEKFKKFYNKVENIKWEIVIVDNYEHKYIGKDGNIDNITIINFNNNNNNIIIGLITITTNDILEYFEESFISNFISIQNSDGLGSSFSQEDFANDRKLSNEQIRISSRTLNGESINKYELKIIN